MGSSVCVIAAIDVSLKKFVSIAGIYWCPVLTAQFYDGEGTIGTNGALNFGKLKIFYDYLSAQGKKHGLLLSC